jgi:poly [ADP-ribose] polymerase 2/3/4
MLIMVDGSANNNKYWSGYIENQGGSFVTSTEWGRVGVENPQRKNYTFSLESDAISKLNTKIREKEKKGYRKIELLKENITVEASKSMGNVADIAINQIDFDKSKKELRDLIETLVKVNVHQIMDFKYDIKINNQGMITTALGIVSKKEIQEAKQILDQLMMLYNQYNTKLWATTEVKRLNERYFARIPKKYRHIEDVLLLEKKDIQAAYQFCDQLEQTADFYETTKNEEVQKSLKAKDDAESNAPKIFDTEIAMIDPVGKEFTRIVRKFETEKNSSHGGRINRCKVKNIYSITIRKGKAEFDKCVVNNVQEYWHGTKASNVLSILKGGLYLPKNLPSSNITGALFGAGAYFSDQSTKSLQYSFGYAPGQASTNLNIFFMFLADVKMGKMYTPSRGSWQLEKEVRKNGCDSCFAKAGYSGVRNNEMIVYSTNQLNLTYLVELEEK